MRQGPTFIEAALKRRPEPLAAPTLLITLEPWHRVFLRNLRDSLWPHRQPQVSLSLVSPTAEFWDDVFVHSRLPWGRFVESAIFHTAAIMVLWSSAQLWPAKPRVVHPLVFHSSEVAYYDAAEYLPPLDTGEPTFPLPQKGDPEHAPQPIISVPPEPDNRQQTIVTPPKLKLSHDVPLPNVVAWPQAQPAIPLAATAQASDLRIPALPSSVVAPPPEVAGNRLNSGPALAEAAIAPAPEITVAASQRELLLPQAAVVEPPPSVATASTRRFGDINIGHSEVVAPAPLLPVGEQHALASLAQASLGSPVAAAVPPPPSIRGTGAVQNDGRLIALNVRPAPQTMPVDPPIGNRRGTFAATPEGKAGASGTPEINHPAGSGSRGTGTSSSKASSAIPPGLFVGAGRRVASNSAVAESGLSSGDPRLMSNAAPVPDFPGRSVASELPADGQSEEERKVFAGRKSYAMTLNVPNLNSASGSWVMHFVELKEGEKPGDLLAPVATRTADPGYPLELMRQNVHGTVSLSAVIHSDGSVGDVRVLNGVDDRLDQYACDALLRWRFLPALRNGNPVPLQAVVMIPFRPRRF